MTKVIVGIDVGKAKVDVAVAGNGAVREWANDEPGRQALSGWLSAQGVELVVLEASGGIERALVSELVERSIPVAVVNPTSEAQDLSLALEGAELTGAGRRWVITGDDKWAHNSPGEPRQVDIVETSFLTGADKQAVEPLSVTLVELPVK